MSELQKEIPFKKEVIEEKEGKGELVKVMAFVLVVTLFAFYGIDLIFRLGSNATFESSPHCEKFKEDYMDQLNKGRAVGYDRQKALDNVNAHAQIQGCLK